MFNTKTAENYLNELLANPNNTLVYNNEKSIIEAFDDIVLGTSRIGYLIICGFKMSRVISRNLGVDNKLVLLISKGKIKTMSAEHSIDSEQFLGAMKEAAKSPEVIVYDSSRNSYQFYVSYNETFYRVVIEFDGVPVGMKCVRANIIITLFKNRHYQRKIKGIFERKFPNLQIKYEKNNGWV